MYSKSEDWKDQKFIQQQMYVLCLLGSMILGSDWLLINWIVEILHRTSVCNAIQVPISDIQDKVHFYCCDTNSTIAIITKTILLLSCVIFRSKCRMGGIHYKSRLKLPCSQTLIYINRSTLTLAYRPPMTKWHCSAKHGNRIGHEGYKWEYPHPLLLLSHDKITLKYKSWYKTITTTAYSNEYEINITPTL